MNHSDRNDEKGMTLVAALVVASLLVMVLVGLSRTAVFRARSGRQIEVAGSTNKNAARMLYELMDLPWTDGKLAVGDHTDPDGPLTWTVEAVTGAPRLRRITVRGTTESGAVTAVGYKYDDF